MNTATLVKRLDWKGDAALYRLDAPVSYYDYDDDDHETRHVVVSAIVARDHGGPETFIFPADEDGEPINMHEISGSQRGTLEHAVALRGAGFEILP